jgi:enterochelin esterase-like enzyme
VDTTACRAGNINLVGGPTNMNAKTLGTIVSSLCLVMAVNVNAQRSSTPRPQIPQIESPVVHSDRTVTFNFRAPNAKQVELSGQFLKGNQPLKADMSSGLWTWTVTVGPVEPNLYPYCFVVDGVQVADPANQDIFPNEHFKNSLVDIPGDKPSIHSVQNVPHGELTYCYYSSKTLNVTRPLIVYTPPGYRAGTDKYPVLYLVSGTTDTEETWFKVGRANFILDNLIAQKRAVPMIIVMPYWNMLNGTPDPSTLQAADMYKVFSADLVGSIMPYVEANYRVIPEREKRAIAGFSRGGGQALFAGFSNLDKFAWIGSYSAYLTQEVFDKYFADLGAKPDVTNKQLKLLWMGVGKEDFLYQRAVEFDNLLKEKKIDHKILFTGGGHTWMNARHYLTETAQLYFK